MGGKATVGSGRDMTIVIVLDALSTDTEDLCQLTPTEGKVAMLLSYCGCGAYHLRG
jgi:hypothetical protein